MDLDNLPTKLSVPEEKFTRIEQEINIQPTSLPFGPSEVIVKEEIPESPDLNCEVQGVHGVSSTSHIGERSDTRWCFTTLADEDLSENQSSNLQSIKCTQDGAMMDSLAEQCIYKYDRSEDGQDTGVEENFTEHMQNNTNIEIITYYDNADRIKSEEEIVIPQQDGCHWESSTTNTIFVKYDSEYMSDDESHTDITLKPHIIIPQNVIENGDNTIINPASVFDEKLSDVCIEQNLHEIADENSGDSDRDEKATLPKNVITIVLGNKKRSERPIKPKPPKIKKWSCVLCEIASQDFTRVKLYGRDHAICMDCSRNVDAPKQLCVKCNLTLPNWLLFKRHFNLNHCDLDKLLEEPVIQLDTRVKENPYECQICFINFQNKTKLISHGIMKHDVCYVCSKSFPSDKDLALHIRKDHFIERERQTQCSTCHSLSTSSNSGMCPLHFIYFEKDSCELKIEESFECDLCKEVFSDIPAHLALHLHKSTSREIIPLNIGK